MSALVYSITALIFAFISTKLSFHYLTTNAVIGKP